MQVFRWDLAGRPLDTPVGAVLWTPVGIAVLVGALVGSSLPWLFLAYWRKGEEVTTGDLGVLSVLGLILGSSLILALFMFLAGAFEWVPARIGWLCWVAFASGEILAFGFGWLLLISLGQEWPGSYRAPSRTVTGSGWAATLVLLVGPTYWLMLPSPPPPRVALEVPSCQLRSAALSPDGQTLVAAVVEDEQQQLETWDVAGGEKLSSVPIPGGDVARLEVAPGGALLAEGVAATSRCRLVWRVAAKERLSALPMPACPDPRTVCFLGADKLAIAEVGSIRVVDLVTGTEQNLPVEPVVIVQVVASGDGKVVAAVVGPDDVRKRQQVYLWALPETKPRRQPLAGRLVGGLALSADGRRLAAISAGRQSGVGWPGDRERWIQVFDVATGKEIARREGKGNVLALNPDGRVVAYCTRGSNLDDRDKLFVWSLHDQRLTEPKVSSGKLFIWGRADLRFSSDGRRLVLANEDGREVRELLGRIRRDSLRRSLGLPMDGGPQTDLEKEETLTGLSWDYPRLKPGEPFRVVGRWPVLSPDLRLVASLMRDRFLLVQECGTDKGIIRLLPVEPQWGDRCSWSIAPDGRHLAVPLSDGTVIILRLYDVEPQRLLAACDEILAGDPRNVSVLLQRGELRLKAGQFAGALADARAALVAQPRSRPALHLLGRAHARHGQPAEAARVFDELIRLDDKDALAWYYRGLAHADCGNIARGRRDLEQALKLDPSLARGPGTP
jgi:hypothetical protein